MIVVIVVIVVVVEVVTIVTVEVFVTDGTTLKNWAVRV